MCFLPHHALGIPQSWLALALKCWSQNQSLSCHSLGVCCIPCAIGLIWQPTFLTWGSFWWLLIVVPLSTQIKFISIFLGTLPCRHWEMAWTLHSFLCLSHVWIELEAKASSKELSSLLWSRAPLSCPFFGLGSVAAESLSFPSFQYHVEFQSWEERINVLSILSS